MKVEGVTYMLMAQDMDRAVAFYGPGRPLIET